MTLPRTLEPEVMESEENARDYDEMDHSQVNRVFVNDLLTAGEDLSAGLILDLGTGTALIPIELCRRHEDCRVIACDLSISMLDLARYHLEAASLTQRVQLDHVDAKQLPYSDGMFGVVLSNSIIHHIPDPLQVLREAVRVLAPKGLVFFRDLARPATAAEVDRLVETYAGKENSHSRKLFRDSLHAALTLAEIQALVAEVGFDSASVVMSSDRHWTWMGRKGT